VAPAVRYTTIWSHRLQFRHFKVKTEIVPSVFPIPCPSPAASSFLRLAASPLCSGGGVAGAGPVSGRRGCLSMPPAPEGTRVWEEVCRGWRVRAPGLARVHAARGLPDGGSFSCRWGRDLCLWLRRRGLVLRYVFLGIAILRAAGLK